MTGDDKGGNWRDRLTHIAGEFIGDAQRVGRWALAGSGTEPYEIVPYRGYGDGKRMLVQGRAIQSNGLGPSTEHDTLLVNLLNTYKRIDSHPLAHATVRITIGNSSREVKADNEGFFREWIDLPASVGRNAAWQSAALQLVTPLRARQPDVRAVSQIRVPTDSSTFGVISDLDDTVIQSRIANFLQAVRTVMLGNARTRLPFAGVSAFYSALERGGDGKRSNPIFYVSSSPWNIHDVIAEFLSLQKIPDGPLLLRDWDINLAALTSTRLQQHKEPLIHEILDLYPSMRFILIGDTSQHDPEIYRDIVKAYPNRILAIYIRSVSPNPQRLASVQALSKEVLDAGSSLVLADDTAAAAQHALENGWIAPEHIEAVNAEKRADEGKTGTKSDAPGVPDDPHEPTIVVE